MLSVKLVVVGGQAKTKEVRLKLPSVIGRGREGVSVTLPHKLVSRKHTELFEQDGQLFVRDLGSLNGTYVNNQRIADSQPLKPNELLTLGDVTFRAVYDFQGVAADPVVPAFQEVTPSENVLDDEVAPNESDTGKSLVEVNAADLDDANSEFSRVEPVEQPKEVAAEEKVAAEAKLPSDPKEVAEPVSAAAGSSDIFSDAPHIEGPAPDKSISVSALADLPVSQNNAGFEVQLDGVEAPKSIKQVEIELDTPARAAETENSKLGSFLKKLPR